jgi:hypothetical protein
VLGLQIWLGVGRGRRSLGLRDGEVSGGEWGREWRGTNLVLRRSGGSGLMLCIRLPICEDDG